MKFHNICKAKMLFKGQTTEDPTPLLEITNPSFFNWEITL
jgi:hypothetical protein